MSLTKHEAQNDYKVHRNNLFGYTLDLKLYQPLHEKLIFLK